MTPNGLGSPVWGNVVPEDYCGRLQGENVPASVKIHSRILGDEADSSGDARVLEKPMRKGATIFPVAILLLAPLLTTMQAGGTTSTNGAVVPHPPQTGVIVPLYTSSLSAWTPVMDAKAAHPGIPIVGIINPKDGPGSASNA